MPAGTRRGLGLALAGFVLAGSYCVDSRSGGDPGGPLSAVRSGGPDRVDPSRWVVHLSDEGASGRLLPYFTDLGRGPWGADTLLEHVQPLAEVLPEHFRCAPGGQALAFLVDATRDGVRELHAVALAPSLEVPLIAAGPGARPGIDQPLRMDLPTRVDQGAPVVRFAWAPDASGLAYVTEEEGRLEVYVASWPFDGSRLRLGSAGGTGRLSWVEPNLLVYEGPNGSSTVTRRTGGAFDIVGELPVAGEVLDARGGRGSLKEDMHLCAGAWHRVDFGRMGSVAPGAAPADRAVPRVERTARVEDGVLQVSAGERLLARVPVSACDAVSWSRDGKLLVSVDEGRRVRVTAVSEASASHEIVGGAYGPALENPRPEFDASGRWLKFHDADELFVSRIEGGRPGPAVAVAGAGRASLAPLETRGGRACSAFAPRRSFRR